MIATCFNIGCLPIMPGTWASMVAMLLYILVRGNTGLVVFFAALFFVLGVWASGIVEKKVGSKDPSVVVIDELMGQFVTLMFLPFSLLNICLGFILFRFFDIIKTPIGRKIEELPSGWGIMLDDLFAGILANLCLRLIGIFIN